MRSVQWYWRHGVLYRQELEITWCPDIFMVRLKDDAANCGTMPTFLRVFVMFAQNCDVSQWLLAKALAWRDEGSRLLPRASSVPRREQKSQFLSESQASGIKPTCRRAIATEMLLEKPRLVN